VKPGDLVRVFQPKSCGGLSLGAIGLVLEKDIKQPKVPRWKIMWLLNNEIMPGYSMKESTTYGYGIEVISEI
jgi:hypothetical protein